jgi:hypothetical protein
MLIQHNLINKKIVQIFLTIKTNHEGHWNNNSDNNIYIQICIKKISKLEAPMLNF